MPVGGHFVHGIRRWGSGSVTHQYGVQATQGAVLQAGGAGDAVGQLGEGCGGGGERVVWDHRVRVGRSTHCVRHHWRRRLFMPGAAAALQKVHHRHGRILTEQPGALFVGTALQGV